MSARVIFGSEESKDYMDADAALALCYHRICRELALTQSFSEWICVANQVESARNSKWVKDQDRIRFEVPSGEVWIIYQWNDD